MQLSLFEPPGKPTENNTLLYDLFQAYYSARKNKRNTVNQLRYEIDYERNLFELYNQIISYTYQPKRSICFIVNNPVKREVFAADFSDRVVHHLIYNYISPIFEKVFINDSYSCRKGKGTHYGIKRIDKFIRSCSQNYTKDCYILKLYIKGYFMAINRSVLFKKVMQVIVNAKYKPHVDLQCLTYLIEQTIFNDSTKNCTVKGSKTDWKGLPQSKSLFYSEKGCGLPIGNLTSQLFGNVYMNEFDHWVKKSLGIKYYGRYVDDFILIHNDKNCLKSLVEPIRIYLQQELGLVLHPNKIYLQHFTKGVKYLGAVIMPHRIYIANRTKGNFYNAIAKQNKIVRNHKPSIAEQQMFQSSMNSYLGIIKHYSSFKLRKTMLFKNISGWWWNYTSLTGGIGKFVLKKNMHSKRCS